MPTAANYDWYTTRAATTAAPATAAAAGTAASRRRPFGRRGTAPAVGAAAAGAGLAATGGAGAAPAAQRAATTGMGAGARAQPPLSTEPGQLPATHTWMSRGADERWERAARPMSFVSALSALQEGKLPTNAQIDALIDRFLTSDEIERRRYLLSEQGDVAWTNFTHLLQALKDVLDHKNADEEIQKFIWYTRQAATSRAQHGMEQGIETAQDPAARERAMAKGKGTFDRLSSIARLTLTDQEFREILFGFNALFQDIVSGIGRGHPTEYEEPSSYQPATTYEPVGGTEKSRVTEGIISEPGPSYAGGSAEDVVVELAVPVGRERVYTVPVGTDVSRQDSAYRTDTRTSRYSGFADEGHGVSTTTPAAPVRDMMRQETLLELMGYLQRLMVKAHTNQDYLDALKYMLQMIEQMEHGTFALTPERRHIEDMNLIQAQHSLQAILERFANDSSLRPLLDTLDHFADRLFEDFALRDVLRNFRIFLQDSLDSERYVVHPDYTPRGAELIRRVREVLASKYVNETQQLADEVNQYTDGLRHDELTGRLADETTRFMNSLVRDPETGAYTLKVSLIGDIGTVFLPALLEQMKYIPIPRIEYEDASWHLIIEDIMLQSSNFLPGVMDVEVTNRAVVGFRRRSFRNLLATGFTVNMHEIHAEVEDMPFYFHKKTGFPRIRDAGVADLTISGRGISTHATCLLDLDNPHQTLVPESVAVAVNDLKLNVHDTRNDTMYRSIAPLLNRVITARVQSTLEEQMRQYILTLDRLLTSLKGRFIQQPTAGGRTPVGARRTVSRLFGAVGLGKRESGLGMKGKAADTTEGKGETPGPVTLLEPLPPPRQEASK
ncbi:hypothetical protein BC832DRAFT_595995 [Gaertneriomyces semiglobifer]|nr:hypothetical protein BC832DRAFT_595995 [Gaertneriomyces semiglobifer]